jgi:hypothetical protein
MLERDVARALARGVLERDDERALAIGVLERDEELTSNPRAEEVFSGTDVVREQLRGDQELVGLLLRIGHEEPHAIRVDPRIRGGQLTDAQDVEHAVLETSSGGLLEHELGRSIGDDLAIDFREGAGPDHPDARALMRKIQPTLRAQAVQANSVMGSDPEFVDLDRGRRQLGARNQEHGSTCQLELLQSITPIRPLQ